MASPDAIIRPWRFGAALFMSIFDDVLSFIANPDPARFEPLALEVFAYQWNGVAPYRAFCLERNVRPERVRSWLEIPAVSTLAFKYVELRDSVSETGGKTFVTSGTSLGRAARGRHFVPRIEVYRRSALRHLRAMMFCDNARPAMLALHPTAERMPESSLAQMVSWCMEEFGSGSAICVADSERVDTDRALDFLRATQRRGDPVCILTTTAALATLLEASRQSSPIRLPAGSRLMDTGGAKGQREPLTREEVIEECGRWLGIQPALVINEYGMTELCSQLYDATAFNSLHTPPSPRVKLAPAWLRVAAVSPVTLAPMPDGVPGILCFFDLANVGSVSAILTDDVGVLQGGVLHLLGRASGAEPRGCALAVGQFAAAGQARVSGAPAR